MQKKAVITVKSMPEEEKDNKIEVVSIGTFEKKNDQYIIKYQETELSGMEGTETTIIVRNDSFSLNREGTTETKIDFLNNKESIVLYKTPYGIINMKVFTKELDINVDDNGGEIHTVYILVLEDGQNVITHLSINIKIEK